MVVEVSLTAAALFNLERHHLVERSPRSRLLDVVDDMLGVNAQGILNAYLSLWSRMRSLSPNHLDEALYDRRELVKTWLMRNTVHIVSSRLLPLYRRALLTALLERWNRWAMRVGAKAEVDEWRPLYQRVLRLLDDGPLTIREMLTLLGWGKADRLLLNRVVREMSLMGMLCHAGALGPWYHAAEYRFARIDRWLKPIPLQISEEEAGRELARRYLRAYGPASPRDFAYWSGMRVREAREIFESLNLVEVEVEGERLLLLDEDVDPLLEASEGEGAVRLLPAFDSLIMGHRDKRRLIPPGYKSRIFLPRGDVAATLLLGHRIGGTWSLKKQRGNRWLLTLSPFRPLTRGEREGIEGEIERLRGFTGFEIEVQWRQSKEQSPLC